MAYKRSRQAFEADLQKQESPYVFYGTPLPPLDDHVRDDGSFVPAWKQEVTDDRGRKRLHGAFTGGFSAGYYNTVGSKEGWAPSTFVSSRKNRAKEAKAPSQQRPEDYMDEEDLREAEDARQLQTADGFSGFGTEHDERHKATIMDIFHPAGDGAGVRLLKRMGWKEGQGIGPKVKRPAKLDNNSRSDDLHSFAPEDVAMLSFTQKRDRKGLGYEGEDTGHNGTPKPLTATGRVVHSRGSKEEDDDHNDSNGPIFTVSKPKSLKKKGAFGYGVLNDTGSDDDDDPYSMGPKISYNRIIGGDKKPKKKPPPPSTTANPSLKAKPVLLSKKLASIQGALRKCHDGRLPLDGFVLGDDLDGMAALSLKSDKYKPPAVPSSWKSSFTPETESDANTSFLSTSDAAKTSTLTSISRATILGETPLPGKSVFDFLTPSARDRLVSASGKTNLPPGLGEKPTNTTSSPDQATLASQIPQLPQPTALQALSRARDGWMPYSDDLTKQTRYKTYLEIRAGLHPSDTGDPLPPRAPSMSHDDYILELHEFARAAEVFRPVTGLMASRFTTSSTTLLQSPSSDTDETGRNTDQLLRKPQTKPLDPAEEAARMGMFGQLTRSYVNFYPGRLLCKRFGVPMPMPVPGSDGPTHTSGSGSESAQTSMPMPFTQAQEGISSSFTTTSKFRSAGYQTPDTTESINATSGKATSIPAATQSPHIFPTNTAQEAVSSNSIDTERNEALEQPKPGLALFKAIFGSDDEEDDD